LAGKYGIFKSIFFKFPRHNVTILTFTNRFPFQYISLVLQGDSGGPLVYLESDGLYTEVGIVSFGAAPGCQQGYPIAFTRVSSYLSWISLKTGVHARGQILCNNLFIFLVAFICHFNI
jgi:hypothetical protein